MNILHLVSYSLYSGPLPSTLGLALAQRKLGHHVWMAHDTKRIGFSPYEEDASPRLAGLGISPSPSFVLSAKSNPFEMASDLWAMGRFCRAEKIDILHMHLSHDHLLGRVALLPAYTKRVRTVHAARSLCPRFGQGWSNRSIDAWITRCEQHQKQLHDFMGIKSAVIHGGIDLNNFTPATTKKRTAAREHFGFPAEARVLAHMALMNGRGQEELLEAAAHIMDPNLHVLFVGEGDNVAALKTQADTLQLTDQVHFSGYLKGPDLHHAYDASDAVFTAQAGNDASCRAALEGMASGLPLIAIKVDALKELVNHNVGYPVDSRDPVAIAQALRAWLSCAVKSAHKGQAGRNYIVAERSFAQEAVQTIALYAT